MGWLTPLSQARKCEYRHPDNDKWYRCLLAPLKRGAGSASLWYVNERAVDEVTLDDNDARADDACRARTTLSRADGAPTPLSESDGGRAARAHARRARSRAPRAAARARRVRGCRSRRRPARGELN